MLPEIHIYVYVYLSKYIYIYINIYSNIKHIDEVNDQKVNVNL